MDQDPIAFQVAVPAARSQDLVSREADGELLLYDSTRQHIHRLNKCAANVWAMCDGRRTVSDIVRQMQVIQPTPVVTEDAVHEAIDKLADANLFVSPPPEELRIPSPSRRNLLKRAAITAGAALAVPVVISLTAPKTGFAQSIDEGAPCDEYHGCPDGYVCCHRPQVYGDRCWSDPDLCVM
jgi:hypothetical protein